MAKKLIKIKEIWRPVVGYEGWYEVSNHGRIKRIKKGPNTAIGKIIKSQVNPCGYLVVMLFNGTVKDKKLKRIHRLVLTAFKGLPKRYQECNHINGVKTDNMTKNLEWITKSENQRHMVRKLRPKFVKMSINKVIEIRKLLEGPSCQREIAERFNISRRTISDIKTMHTWRT